MPGGKPAESDLGVTGRGSTSRAKMAAAVGVSLRRWFPATALGGACLQVSSGAGGRGQAWKSRRRPGAEGAAGEAEGGLGRASGRLRTHSPPRSALIWAWSIPVGHLSARRRSLSLSQDEGDFINITTKKFRERT